MSGIKSVSLNYLGVSKRVAANVQRIGEVAIFGKLLLQFLPAVDYYFAVER